MNAVVKASKNEIAVMDFGAYAGAGGEDVTAQDRKIPLLKILEPLADNLKRSNERYIEGAKAGDIVDTSVNEVVGTEIDFLPVKFAVEFVEWQDKKPVARHMNRSILAQCTFRDEKGQRKGFFLPNGNEVSETKIFYGLNLTTGVWCSIPMARGRLGAGTNFLERLERIKLPDGRKAPYFYKVWNLKAVETQKGDDVYRTWAATPVKLLQEFDGYERLFQEAVQFLELLNSGKASADLEADADNATNGDVM